MTEENAAVPQGVSYSSALKLECVEESTGKHGESFLDLSAELWITYSGQDLWMCVSDKLLGDVRAAGEGIPLE